MVQQVFLISTFYSGNPLQIWLLHSSSMLYVVLVSRQNYKVIQCHGPEVQQILSYSQISWEELKREKTLKLTFFLCRKYQSSMQLLPSFSPGSDLVLYYVSTLQGDGHLFICFLPKSVYFSSVSQKLLFLGWLIPRSFLYSSKNCQGISTWQIITV